MYALIGGWNTVRIEKNLVMPQSPFHLQTFQILDYVMSFIEKFLGNQLTNECY
jgi:hypothetical protein